MVHIRHLFILLGVVLVTTGCRSDRAAQDRFVRMVDGRFVVGNEPYFALVMNYNVDLLTDGESIWPAVNKSYFPDGKYPCSGPEDCLLVLRSEFALIAKQGFNAVRIVNMAEGPKTYDGTGVPQLKLWRTNGTDTVVPFHDEAVLKAYVQAVRTTMSAAAQEGLRVIPLTTIHNDAPWTLENFILMADAFRGDTAVLAFDLFNEPLYFDTPPRRKEDVHRIVKNWRKVAREHVPDHLITIGLTGIRETHAWDPNILDVDFISFHPYEYEPDQVLNEIRWYGRHVDVPWMIGETSLPADNDSVSYTEQVHFAQRTLDQVRACGGIGYSWWQFKDVRWGRFHSDYMGLMALEGTTRVQQGRVDVVGTEKPVAEIFRSFDPRTPLPIAVELPNYLNYSGHRTSRISGRLVDREGAPIEGGVVLAWNEDYSHSYHTTSTKDGSFILYGDMYFHHWIASANGYDMVRGDCDPTGFRRASDGVPDHDLGRLDLGLPGFVISP